MYSYFQWRCSGIIGNSMPQDDGICLISSNCSRRWVVHQCPKCLGLAHIPPQRVSVDEDPEAIAAEAADGQRWTSTGHMAFLTVLSI